MYNRHIEEIQSDIRFFSALEDVVNYLNARITTLIALRVDLMAIKRYDRNNAGEITLSRIRTSIPEILEQEARTAIGIRKEFNTTGFWEGLRSAIYDERTYDATIDSTTGGFEFSIHLNRTAGTLYEYGRAVEKVRKDLQIGPYNKLGTSPTLASKMWKEKYYGPAREGKTIPVPPLKPTKSGKHRKERKRTVDVQKYIRKYWRTIRLRRSYFRHPAPWWQLLNDGTAELSSDWGGTAYPTMKPTKFVQKAVRRTKERFSRVFMRVKEEVQETSKQIHKIDRAITYAEVLLVKIERKINTGGDNRSSKPSVAEVREFAREQVIAQLESRYSLVDAERLEILVDKLVGDLDISEEKFTLSKPGNKRVRVRYVELQEAVRRYRQGLR